MKKDIQNNAEYLEHLRHSCAHLLAAAVMELWPDTKRTIGPAIEDGFYYDFDFGSVKLSESDFPKIETRMHEIVKRWDGFTREDVTKQQAIEEYKNNEYKKELIEEFAKEGQKLTFFTSGEYSDLCRGGHIDDPKDELKHFKLLSVAGAYWRGSEKNPMLTRIYGTCFPTDKELSSYLTLIEEAKKRNHKKLGRDLELFTISNDVGQGLTLWLPNGATMRREIENYMVSEQIKMGYKHVYSPHIGQKSLWEKSGHWDLYREKMYSPMDVEGIEYLVKPMTCPMHIQTYQFKPRSYRELPYRIAEIASVYRYEKSGELNGLLRVRAFTQDDAHIFCTQDQAVDEFLAVFAFIQRLYAKFGFTDYKVRLGIRSKKEKYLGNDTLWKKAEEKIIHALDKSNVPYFISEGDAAFYGPKADFMVKDALGREWQCGTVQVDFMLPERFGLTYINQNGQEETPVMIHRAPLGSLERFMAILIENYAGSFPTWISPVQIKVLSITDRNVDFAQKLYTLFIENNVRAEIDVRNETLQSKIRDAQMQKVPYMIIIGDREEKSGILSVRNRTGKTEQIGQEEFIARIKKEIDERSI
jgi:threonyl-tRNA synthetase